ncbi:magnesium transporter MgtE N-terminal domain-containing protein [Nitrospina gracilis]|uniref:magnesium transporter MgtE N-terminal domain-containing protein n=1 Tax=Nitrospina gracilis TaxID=35801 RepID=UPI001F3ED65B|nr:CBS domain-containing protein [Nitrospina gracilis]MCF8719475.1 Mg/Co/Ni transporter MgtE [Nitrospina gracilis Nb-211]
MNDTLAFTRSYLAEYPVEAARVLEGMDSRDSAAYLASMEPEEAAWVMEQMLPWYLEQCVAHWTPEQAAERLDLLSSFRACHVLRLSDADSRKRLLEALPKKKQKVLSRQITFRPDTVGHWMEEPLPVVSEQATVQDALDQLRRAGPNERQHFFVMQRNGRYVGAVEIARLLQESPNRQVTELLDPRVEPVLVQAPLTTVRTFPAWHHAHALPVLNVDHQLEGVLKEAQVREALDTGQVIVEDTSLFESLVPLFLLAATAWVRGMVSLPFLEPPKPPATKENEHER